MSIITVGDLRNMLKNYEDDWKIIFVLEKEGDKLCPYYAVPLNINNEILDTCYSEHEVTICCECDEIDD